MPKAVLVLDEMPETCGDCRDCYKALLQEPIRRLADAACVEWFGVEDDDEG